MGRDVGTNRGKARTGNGNGRGMEMDASDEKVTETESSGLPEDKARRAGTMLALSLSRGDGSNSALHV